MEGAKRRRLAADGGSAPAPAAEPTPATLSCRWEPCADPSTTQREFVVELLPREEGQDGAEAPPTAAATPVEFQWRIGCEKKIPFCRKELVGSGTLPPASPTARVGVDLSSTGYGAMTLVVDGAAQRARAVTTRAVSDQLPPGRSMTRPDPAPDGDGAAATGDREAWAGERQWAAACAKQQPSGGQDAEGETLREISAAELAAHSTLPDGWLAVHGIVYDVSSFAAHHPGGVRTLLQQLCATPLLSLSPPHPPAARDLLTFVSRGGDGTEQFDSVHPQVDARKILGLGGSIRGRLASPDSS